jgi:hypothetical protein
VDDLYALPPAEFTAARDTLAKRLRAEGDKAAAAEVKALRRPTVAAWAVNQVARDQPALVDAVVAAGRDLVAAQETLLGGGGRDELRAAMAARRDAVAAATRAALALAGEAHRDAIHATFDAAATEDGAGEAVRSGRLTRELDPPSSFALLGGFTAPVEPDEPEAEEPPVDEAARAEARAAVAAAREGLAAAEARRDDAGRALEAAGAAVESATRAVAAAEAEVDRLTGG